MGTTASGYPYPEDTATVAQGAQSVKSLATAVETRVRANAAGQVSISVNTSTTLFSKAITFPAGRFKTPSIVVATSSHSWWVAMAANVTATGCTIYLRNVTTGKETATRVAYWQAMV